jgi:hypothetical protein
MQALPSRKVPTNHPQDRNMSPHTAIPAPRAVPPSQGNGSQTGGRGEGTGLHMPIDGRDNSPNDMWR